MSGTPAYVRFYLASDNFSTETDPRNAPALLCVDGNNDVASVVTLAASTVPANGRVPEDDS
ncbi:hypothetical protein FS837_009682 [Tulasnella sp. UAMH 9824]|nr:hypothetical protein FS837_009682 [Tulasnella sp. UAMH 9824]